MLDIEKIDLSGAVPDWATELQPKITGKPLPYAMLLYPASYRLEEPVLWQDALNAETVDALQKAVYSPVNRELCRLLVSGCTCP